MEVGEEEFLLTVQRTRGVEIQTQYPLGTYW